MRAAVALLAFATAVSSAADFSFVKGGSEPTTRLPYPAVVTDVNGDGWLEALGTVNDGKGNLSIRTEQDLGLTGLFTSDARGGVRPSDARMADFNGDGCPDLVAQGYGAASLDK